MDRYLAGAHREVWAEMTQLGSSLRSDSYGLRAAREVSDETMRRLRRNVECLVPLLKDAGYVFERAPLVAPLPDTADLLQELESEVGPVPLALDSWWRVVGTVDLTGERDGWSFFGDPLVLDTNPAGALELAEEWFDDDERLGAFELDVAPDVYHKADISGGGPYAIGFVDTVDPLLLHEPHGVLLTEYLRLACAHAGFPGWSGRVSRPDWAPGEVPQEFAAWVCQLEEF